MKKHIYSREFDRQLDQPGEGRRQQQLITLSVVDNKLHRVTITRNFTDDDYTDSVNTEVLGDVR